jgi:hypothetical protein
LRFRLDNVSSFVRTVANIASKPPFDEEKPPNYYTKFELQNLSARLLPDEKMSQCLRYRASVNFEKNSPIWNTVEVHKSQSTGKAHYEHLIVCDRVWGCPVCASRISEARRKALTLAVERSGYQTVLATFTLSHHLGDDLDDLCDAVSGAFRRLKSGRFWQGLKNDFDWLGDVRSLEVTWGEVNGWHPHIHALMIFEHELGLKELEDLEKRLKERWLAVLVKLGMTADWEHGCDVRAGDQEVRDYVAKHGKLPEIEKKSAWTVEHEVVKSHVKQGRIGGKTPFELLGDYGNGDDKAGRLFVEYYNCFKGKHQLQWSRGLRALLNMDEIEEEIAEEEQSGVDQMIVELCPADWRKICYNQVRGVLLKVASEGDVDDIWGFIDDLVEPPLKKRRRTGYRTL